MKKTLILCLLAMAMNPLFAKTNKYVLTGKVMDTSGNWLNDARVGLKWNGAVTQTDPNGNFSLTLLLTDSKAKGYRGVIDYLEVDKEGHASTSTKITSLKFFTDKKPLTIKLEPNPSSGDNLGFSTRMSIENTVPRYLLDLHQKAGFTSKSTDIDPEVFERIIKERKISPADEKSGQAKFNVYIPDSVKKVKAAFYISRHGIGTTDHPVLRAFAKDEKIALIGFNGDPVQRGLLPAALLDEHIAKLAEISKHPELTKVPFFTFGHSNGTGFAGCLPSQRPERVIAWISYHAGTSNYLQFPNTEKVPSLVMCGAIDDWFRNHRQDKAVENMRKKRNASMSLMMEGSVGHGPVNKKATWEFIVKFCKATMEIRLKPDGTLRDIDTTKGWLGANYNLEKGGQQLLKIAPYSKFRGDKSRANWFPNETFARTWQMYGNTNPSVKSVDK